MGRQSLGQRLSSLRVGQKIGLGYTLALSIAVCGTIAGFGVGDLYQQETQQRQQHARNKVELLHRLQSRVLQTRTHQQQLIPLAQYPAKFQGEYAHLLKHEREIEAIWAELKAFVAKPPTLQAGVRQATITAWLQTYEGVSKLYSQELERRVERIRSLDLASPTDVEQAQALMLEFTNSDLALEFDRISEDLVGLIDQGYQELEVATRSDLQASEVAEKVVVASIGLSVAIAIFLAILTSRAIAEPIQSLTSVARRRSEER